MKKILTLTACLFSLLVFAQTFEGKIVYQNTYQSKMPGMTSEQFSSVMGTGQEYLIKGGNYKSTLNGNMFQWQLYINKENKIYSKMANSETLYWTDAGTNADSVYTIEVHKGATEILGYKCDEVVLVCKSGIQKYYFSSKLGVDPSLFAKHKYGNWYEYIKTAKALPLKMVIDSEQFEMTSTATSVTAMKLDDKDFQLPANAKTEKAPF